MIHTYLVNIGRSATAPPEVAPEIPTERKGGVVGEPTVPYLL
jgi:hypothetical protein